jgi:hypothetical protein
MTVLRLTCLHAHGNEIHMPFGRLGFLGSKFSVLNRTAGWLAYDELQLVCAAHRRTPVSLAMR